MTSSASSSGNHPISNALTSHHHFSPAITNSTLSAKASAAAAAITTAVSDKFSLFFTKDFLQAQVLALAKANINPFSTPDNLGVELKKTKQHKNLLLKMFEQFDEIRQKNLRHLNKLSKDTNASPEHIQKAESLEVLYDERLTNLKEAINITEGYIKYLKFKKNSIVTGRFAGKAGSVANMIYPGSKLAVSAVGTIAAAAAPAIHSRRQRNPREQNSTQHVSHWSIAFSALSFVATTSISYYVWPVVNEFVSQYFSHNQQQ